MARCNFGKSWEGHVPGRLVTFVSLLTCGGATKVYGIYQGPLRASKDGTPYLSFSGSTRRVGTECLESEEHADYRTLANRYASADAPAFDFGR